MDFKNQNMFGSQVFQNQVNLNQNSALGNTVSNLKAMSMDPSKKNEVLSSLTRFQNQMNPNDYNEILSNIKSMNGQSILDRREPTLETKRGITDKDYQQTVSDLRRLEHEMRFK